MEVKFLNSENTYKKDEIIPVVTGVDLSTPTAEPVGREVPVGREEPVGRERKQSKVG